MSAVRTNPAPTSASGLRVAVADDAVDARPSGLSRPTSRRRRWVELSPGGRRQTCGAGHRGLRSGLDGDSRIQIDGDLEATPEIARLRYGAAPPARWVVAVDQLQPFRLDRSLKSFATGLADDVEYEACPRQTPPVGGGFNREHIALPDEIRDESVDRFVVDRLAAYRFVESARPTSRRCDPTWRALLPGHG